MIQEYPDELVCHILGFLDLEDLVQIGQTIRRLYHLSNDKQIWQQKYLIEWNSDPTQFLPHPIEKYFKDYYRLLKDGFKNIADGWFSRRITLVDGHSLCKTSELPDFSAAVLPIRLSRGDFYFEITVRQHGPQPLHRIAVGVVAAQSLPINLEWHLNTSYGWFYHSNGLLMHNQTTIDVERFGLHDRIGVHVQFDKPIVSHLDKEQHEPTGKLTYYRNGRLLNTYYRSYSQMPVSSPRSFLHFVGAVHPAVYFDDTDDVVSFSFVRPDNLILVR